MGVYLIYVAKAPSWKTKDHHTLPAVQEKNGPGVAPGSYRQMRK